MLKKATGLFSREGESFMYDDLTNCDVMSAAEQETVVGGMCSSEVFKGLPKDRKGNPDFKSYSVNQLSATLSKIDNTLQTWNRQDWGPNAFQHKVQQTRALQKFRDKVYKELGKRDR